MAGKVSCPKCNGMGKISDTASGTCGNCFGTGTVDAPKPTNSNSSISGVNDCFGSDTRVLTATGWKKIALIVKGELVATNIGSTVTFQPVKTAKRHENIRLVSVKLEGKERKLEATERHPVMTERGWVSVKNLKQGDVLPYIDVNGSCHSNIVEAIHFAPSGHTVHNLVVAGDYTFLTEHCVAHSFVELKFLRTLLAKTYDRLTASLTRHKQRNSIA